jgi:hypothetical protein
MTGRICDVRFTPNGEHQAFMSTRLSHWGVGLPTVHCSPIVLCNLGRAAFASQRRMTIDVLFVGELLTGCAEVPSS